MALTFPLDMRSWLADAGIRFHRPEFRLQPRIATATLPNVLQVMETSPAAWRATWRTAPMTHEQASKAEAFVSAVGGARRFLGFNPFRPWPAAHRAGVGVSATYSVAGLTANTITIGAAAGVTLSTGDLIGLEKPGAGRYALFQVLETVVSTGSLTVTVAPSVPNHFTAGDVCRLHRPVSLMVLDPQNAPSFTGLVSRTEMTFSGVQAAQ